jgi:IS1 family transposase
MNGGLMWVTRLINAGCGMPLTIPLTPVLAYVFGKRKDEVFLTLKTLPEPCNIVRYYTDDWGTCQRHPDPDKHEVGKRNTQKTERKNLNFGTRIKRLNRKAICFSKLESWIQLLNAIRF